MRRRVLRGGNFPNFIYAGFQFCISYVPCTEVGRWRKLSGEMMRAFRRKRFGDEYRHFFVELKDIDVTKRLAELFHGIHIPYPHGVVAIMISGNDANGLTVPEYVMDFYRQVGGEFSVSIRVV